MNAGYSYSYSYKPYKFGLFEQLAVPLSAALCPTCNLTRCPSLFVMCPARPCPGCPA